MEEKASVDWSASDIWNSNSDKKEVECNDENVEKNTVKVCEAPIEVYFDIVMSGRKPIDLNDKPPHICTYRLGEYHKVKDPTFKLASVSRLNKNSGYSLLIMDDKELVLELPLRHNFPAELVRMLDSLSGYDPKTLSEAYSLAGLWRRDKLYIIHGTNKDLVRYIYIELSISLDEQGYVNHMYLSFHNQDGKRISTNKCLYMGNKNTGAYLNGIEIGPDGNYGEGDSRVVRNIYCDYCGDLICVSSYADYFENDKNRQICKNCKDIPTKNTDTEETRTYAISGTPEQLDTLEALFNEINVLCAMGSSRKIRLYVDGDGAVNLHIKPQEGELNNKAAGYGNLKRNPDGYLSYLDLG